MKNKIIVILAVLLVMTAFVSCGNVDESTDMSKVTPADSESVTAYIENLNLKVPNYYSLANYNYNGDFDEFAKDTYNWYKSIENKEGVYIINSSYNSDELLKIWKDNNVYKTIPNKAFWDFTVSPSYLKEMNISIDNKDLEDAMNGIRLYLVPNNLSDDDFEIMKAYLEEVSLYEVDKSTIKTNFVNNKKVKIIRYTPNNSYFTWPKEKGEPITDNAPIIYVCTSENMKYFESESLYATGIDGYVKFSDKETMENFTKDDLLKKYNLNFKTSSQIYKDASKDELVDSGIEKVFK